MKPWQKGFDLSYLKALEIKWEGYNEHSLSPFSQMKKNSIATYLDKKMLVLKDDYSYVTGIVNSPSKINMFKGVAIGEKQKGDRIVDKINFDPRNSQELIDTLYNYEEPTWLYVWQENDEYIKLAIKAGFEFVGSKFSSFSEIVGVWFKETPNKFFGEREHLNYLPEEDHIIRHVLCDVDMELIVKIREKLEDYGMNFENHYSKYNDSKSWSAISLRGYSSDPNFITDPEEMNKKWHEKHKDQTFKMQDTELRDKFPEVDRLLSWVTTPIHRIRFMKLSPGGGTLERHTDQTDPKTGVKNGKLMRFHWPIRSNSEVIFNVWDKDGLESRTHMAIGSCWYLDIRKPHRAVNNGISDRIHLVVDVEASDSIRDLL